MSDQPTLTSPSIQDVLTSTSSTASTDILKPFECTVPGCDFKSVSEAGLKRHITRTHAPKKRGRPKGSKNKKPLTPTQKAQAAIPNLRPIWQVGDQIILIGPYDSVWIAKKVQG